MKLMRATALAGIARKAYTEARKPQNQARIKGAVGKVRQRKTRGNGSAR